MSLLVTLVRVEITIHNSVECSYRLYLHATKQQLLLTANWGGVYGGKDLRKRYLLSLEWKRVGVMDNDSGDDETDELREFG